MIAQRPVVGFRSWRASNGALWPMQWPTTVDTPPHYYAWAHDPARAECISWRHCEAPPTEECECGLYATARLSPHGGGLVCGAIVAWGRIVLHERGFRAQYARPIALLAEDSYPAGFDPAGKRAQHIAAVAERLGLPTLPAHELAAYAAWHGDPLVHPALAVPRLPVWTRATTPGDKQA